MAGQHAGWVRGSSPAGFVPTAPGAAPVVATGCMAGWWPCFTVSASLHLKPQQHRSIVAFSFLNAEAALLKACLPGSKGHGCHIMHTIADDE